MDKQEKLKAISEVKAKINKDIGKGTVLTLSEKPLSDIEVISTGSLGLDIALGVGGFPKGRIIEIYGSESSGKTTLTMHTIAEAQKKGGICAFIDAEHAFDKSYAESLGINTSELEICQPDYGEQGLEVADRLIASGGFDVVVIDSVAALTPKAEIEGEMGENKMGLHARLMSQALRKLTANVAKTNTILIFINQLREKIGIMYGNPSTTTGGNALKFYASVRLEVSRSTTSDNSVKDGGVTIGNLTKVKVIKNKVSPPFTSCEFNILYGEGIDKISEIISVASELELLKKWGKTITYNEAKYELDQFTSLLKDNEEFKEAIINQIKEKILNDNNRNKESVSK